MAVLECKALTKNYGHVAALDGVDFTIEPGRIVGLLGPNGSGKTTLIKLANGLLTPTSGEILVCGIAPGKESHALVSYLPERTSIPLWMTAGQLLDFYQDFYKDFRRESGCHRCGTWRQRLGSIPTPCSGRWRSWRRTVSRNPTGRRAAW